MDFNDLKDLFFPESLPELDDDIKNNSIDYEEKNISPLEDAKNIVEYGEIEEEKPEDKNLLNYDSSINPLEKQLKDELKLLSIFFHKIIEYYNKLFPERFSNTIVESIEMINTILNDNEISLKNKIEIVKELISQYRQEAIKQLDERAIKIMEAVKSNFEEIEKKQQFFQKPKIDKFRIEINPDDFVDY